MLVILLAVAWSAPKLEEADTLTALESTQRAPGLLTVQSYETVSDFPCEYGADVDVQAVISTSITSTSTLTGLRVRVTEEDRGSRSVFVDADEVRALQASLEYMASFDEGTVPLEEWEVRYGTRGGFAVTLFSGSAGRTRMGITVGEFAGTKCFMDASHLARLAAAVKAARARIKPPKE